MKLTYRLTLITHVPDGRTIESIIQEIDSQENQEVRTKAHEAYEERSADLADYYLPTGPFDYVPSQGLGYALKLEAIWDTYNGEGGDQKTYIIRTTYRKSEGLGQLMQLKEDDLLDELTNPRYPADRFYLDGNSSIGYCEWYDKLPGYYQINLLTMSHFGPVDSEELYVVGHRHLGEARKIALSLFKEEAERFSIRDDFGSENNNYDFYALTLELTDGRGHFLTVEAKPPGLVSTEDQEEEMKIFKRENIDYDRNDAKPSNVNEIEDLWSADHLTVYDYKVMSPYKKYDHVRYIYNLWSIEKGGGEDEIHHIEVFAHHDLSTAQQAALNVYSKKVQELQGKYSPDILDTADPTVTGYNYYLELKEVRKDYRIVTEASFSYDGTDITQKDEEKRVFQNLRRENPSSSFVNNRQKKNEQIEVNDSGMEDPLGGVEDEEDEDFPF